MKKLPHFYPPPKTKQKNQSTSTCPKPNIPLRNKKAENNEKKTTEYLWNNTFKKKKKVKCDFIHFICVVSVQPTCIHIHGESTILKNICQFWLTHIYIYTNTESFTVKFLSVSANAQTYTYIHDLSF